MALNYQLLSEIKMYVPLDKDVGQMPEMCHNNPRDLPAHDLTFLPKTVYCTS